MNITESHQKYQKLRDALEIVNRFKLTKTIYEDKCVALNKKIRKLNFKVKDIDKCCELMRVMVVTKHEELLETFSKTVEPCIKSLFGNDYEFKVGIKGRGKSTNCEFLIKNDETKRFVPLKMCNGLGIAELIALVLQMMFVSVIKGEKVCIIDEPLSGIDLYKQAEIAKFISKVCLEFGLQVIMVTQLETFYDGADKGIML